jgi:FeS assembly SUF system regulator
VILVSKLADYAVVLAVHLAQQPGGDSLSAQGLADATRLPAATVAKVMKALAKAGVVVGARGAAGGYRLARCPSLISVADLVSALDGPMAVTQCSGAGTDHTKCEHLPYCGTKLHWGRINQAVATALAAVTLKDMTAPSALMVPPHKRLQETAGQPLERVTP